MKQQEQKMVTLKMKKLEIFNAGKENFFRYIALLEDYDKLKLANASLINSLKFILSHVDPIEFTYEDDDGLEDDVVEKPKETGMEVA